jgi:hypothetical protein
MTIEIDFWSTGILFLTGRSRVRFACIVASAGACVEDARWEGTAHKNLYVVDNQPCRAVTTKKRMISNMLLP